MSGYEMPSVNSIGSGRGGWLCSAKHIPWQSSPEQCVPRDSHKRQVSETDVVTVIQYDGASVLVGWHSIGSIADSDVIYSSTTRARDAIRHSRTSPSMNARSARKSRNIWLAFIHIAALERCDLLKSSLVPRIQPAGKVRGILKDTPRRPVEEGRTHHHQGLLFRILVFRSRGYLKYK